jgi:hypothetical protein
LHSYVLANCQSHLTAYPVSPYRPVAVAILACHVLFIIAKLLKSRHGTHWWIGFRAHTVPWYSIDPVNAKLRERRPKCYSVPLVGSVGQVDAQNFLKLVAVTISTDDIQRECWH